MLNTDSVVSAIHDNFLLSELSSKLAINCKTKEIDCIEERGGMLYGYEFKWQGEMRKATRNEFTQVYPNARLMTVTRDNYEEFIR